MTPGMEHELMRLLHGELPADEARALRARLFREPELAAAYRRLEQTWQSLSPPPASPVPAGFAGRVMARARSQAAGSLSWSGAPGWARAAAAAALVAGAALGVEAGRAWPPPVTPVTPAAPAEAGADASPAFLAATAEASLADSYWSLVEDVAADGTAEARP